MKYTAVPAYGWVQQYKKNYYFYTIHKNKFNNYGTHK